jgi:LysM repeat protein
VKGGETPTSIARQYGTSVAKLLAANPGLKPARMQIGEELKIPPRN